MIHQYVSAPRKSELDATVSDLDNTKPSMNAKLNISQSPIATAKREIRLDSIEQENDRLFVKSAKEARLNGEYRDMGNVKPMPNADSTLHNSKEFLIKND